ncbi:MAG: prepilin-type N-terminal cleavage/methylation domain-containing protein [Lentisphaerae bacterium]|nr:prepilin-type N-terminal cleavage/methylation domain-containing protein [Lentisphaerota bacterium]
MIDRRQQHGAPGFSLIEVMVATAVLLVVVLMVGAVFRQASSSWDGGYARAEGGMVVRGVLGSIQRELSQAVDGRRFPGVWDYDVPVNVNGSTLEFIRPHFDQEKGQTLEEEKKREKYLLVSYTATSGKIEREQQVLKWNEGSQKWQNDGSPERSDIYKDGAGMRPGYGFKARFKFVGDEVDDPGVGLGPDGNPKTGVFWTVPTVSLRVDLVRTGSFSGLRVRSLGRDGKKDTDDDIMVR